jgi:sugar phosphate isomerase/epimerase
MKQMISRVPIGFQLYTVRAEFARNVPNTLRQLRALGYDAIEFWGYSGTAAVYKRFTASKLRQLLDDSGLQCCGMHLDLKALNKVHLQRTIDNNLALRSEYLNVAAAKDLMNDAPRIKQLADLLNQAAAACAPHGLKVGYHAHPFDFNNIKGQYAWDLLFSQTAPEVNMQMDVGNCLAGRGDPLASLKRFPGRSQTIHLKEHKSITFDGAYYEEVFRVCETRHPVKWYIVEMGGFLGRGFDVPRQALEALRRLGK